MRMKQFFKVFATLVEKATLEPLDEDCDFNWQGYFDSDIPECSQVHYARMAAEEYLTENGWRCDPKMVASDVECVLGDLVSIPRGEV